MQLTETVTIINKSGKVISNVSLRFPSSRIDSVYTDREIITRRCSSELSTPPNPQSTLSPSLPLSLSSSLSRNAPRYVNLSD